MQPKPFRRTPDSLLSTQASTAAALRYLSAHQATGRGVSLLYGCPHQGQAIRAAREEAPVSAGQRLTGLFKFR